MAGVPWRDAEFRWAVAQVKKGRHPSTFLAELNKRFGTNRSESALAGKLKRESVPFAHLLPVPQTKAQIDARITTDQRIQDAKRTAQRYEKLYKQAIKDLNLQENLLAVARNHISALPSVKPPQKPRKIRQKTHEDAVLCLSDIHWGEIVRLEEMGGLNEYNCDVANRRLRAIVKKIEDLTLNKLIGYQIDRLHIFGLGDWVSGIIHDELAENREGNVVSWLIDLAFVVAQMVQELLTIFPRVELDLIYGNHGRIHKKPRYKERHVNFDYMTFQYLSQFLGASIRAERVSISIPLSFWTVKEVRGWRFLLIHGDGIKSWMSIPWYGITRATHKLKELLETQTDRFDCLCLGHFHNRGQLDMMRGEMTINGSVKGADEYSVGKMYTVAPPRQEFFGVHQHEWMTWRFPLNLSGSWPDLEPYKTVDMSEMSIGELEV